MRGYIARATNRSGSQPHWRGKVTIGGKELLLSLWEKEGNPDLMNLSVTDPESLPARAHPGASAAPAPSTPSPAGPSPAGEVGVPQNDFFGDIFGPTA
jgi:hypothetical protein